MLRRRHFDLVKDLVVERVVDQLIQDGIISIDDLDIIDAESTRRNKAIKLLRMVLSGGPTAYNSFLTGLHTNFEHLEKNLKTCEKEILDEWTEEGKVQFHQLKLACCCYVVMIFVYLKWCNI